MRLLLAPSHPYNSPPCCPPREPTTSQKVHLFRNANYRPGQHTLVTQAST